MAPKKIVKKVIRKIRKTTPRSTATTTENAIPETPVISETSVKETPVAEIPLSETTPELAVLESPSLATAPEITAVASAGAIEPAGDAVETAETDVSKTPVKKTMKRIRKVTRRVPVKRTPVEPKEGEGVGEATTPAAVMEEEGKNPNLEMETTLSRDQNPRPVSNRNQSSETENPSLDIEVAASLPASVVAFSPATVVSSPATVGASPATVGTSPESVVPSQVEGLQPQGGVRKVRKVKRRVPVKRINMAAEVAKEEEKGAAVGDETATASATGGALPVEEAAPEVGNLNSVKGKTGVPMEVEKTERTCTIGGSAEDEVTGITERQRRRKTEIFIGGLDRDAKEEDIRKVFGTVGEIVEVRMMMDGQTGKNKGYTFLRYATAAQAKQAVSEFAKVEVRGKQCGAAALEGNDTIFLGNIDKKWKKDDVIKLLHDIGIEKIDTVTVMPDPKNGDLNRGFAFLELETNRDAQTAYKKLQKKDAFGKGQNIKVAWAEPLNDPDEEEMQKVKSVYADGIPTSWDEKRVRECFKKFGEIERVVLARNIQSAKRKDFAFINFKTRESALSCVELFEKEDLTDGGSKVIVKVSLAKPIQKAKQDKGGSKSGNKDSKKERQSHLSKKTVTRETATNVSSRKEQFFKGGRGNVGGDKASTTRELLHVLREQATWKQGQTGYASGPANSDYRHPLYGGKRPLSAVGDEGLYSDPRGHPRPRLESVLPVATPSYKPLSQDMAGTSLQYYQRPTAGYGTGALHGTTHLSRTPQMRPGGTYGSSLYSRY